MTRTTTTTRTKAVSDNAPSSNADDALTREREGGDAGTGAGAGTNSTPTTGGTEAVARSGQTKGRVHATTDSSGVVRGTWEDVDGGDGGDGSSGGGSGGSGGDGGDGDSASGGVSTWLRTKTREMHGATEGGALFGALVAVAMNGIAWVFFSALKPSPAEREQYALEMRRAETAAKERAKAERAARKEMEKAEKRRWITAKPSSAVVPPTTAPVVEAVVEETAETIEGDRNGEADASSASRERAPAVEDKASTSGDSSEDDSAVKIVTVQHRPSDTPASEDEPMEPETSSDSSDAEAESAVEERVRECEEEQHRAKDGFLEKCHHDDEEYLPSHEEHPNYKIIRAVREANALMHDVHARRAEVNHEFAEALRYRKQVIHMAAEHGIPVAPLREIKETFDQEESPPLGVTARKKANQAARSAFSATKKFVHFATPHVQAASSKALEFTKDTAGKATTAASERLKDVKAKQASGELRAPTVDEAVAAAKSTSRRAFGAVIHAYDRIAGHVRELKP